MIDIYREFGVDVFRDCCSENEGPTAAEMKMAKEITRLRARVEVLERLRERIEECEQRRLSADDARKMVRALWCAGFREGELEHRESVSAATLNKAEIESQRCRDAIISALTWGSKP